MARPADARKDQDLLNILAANARTSISDIAKMLGVSRATAQARLARLERDGTIAGYTAVLGKPDHSTAISAIILIEPQSNSRETSLLRCARSRRSFIAQHLERSVRSVCEDRLRDIDAAGRDHRLMPKWMLFAAPHRRFFSPESSRDESRILARHCLTRHTLEVFSAPLS